MLKVNLYRVAYVVLSALMLINCSQAPEPTALERVLQRGELVILTRHEPTTYLTNQKKNTGFEYELVSLFAKQLGVQARFVVPENFQQVLQIKPGDDADFAAAGLSITPEREKHLLFTAPYFQVTQQLIYHYRTRRPKSINSLNSPFFEVMASSSHAENLKRLKREHPTLQWSEVDDKNVYELISLVDKGLLDYTIADSNQFQLLRGKFPQLNAAFDLSPAEKVAWAFPKSGDHSLYDKAAEFLQQVEKSGQLKQLQDKYYGYQHHLDYVSNCTFRQHIKDRLPRLLPYFKESAKKYNLDWKLLASIGYQESHWNEQAISPTGVRGVMMLTRATAKQMKVENRLDAKQSIDGGAHYLFTRLKKIPKRIHEPDRTWFALASYNIGFGHMEDARILTQEQGGNPDRWIDVKKSLPLLTKEEWYKKTRHGYARGKEPIIYIQNIRHYYNTLNQLDAFHEPLDTRIDINKRLKTDLPAL